MISCPRAGWLRRGETLAGGRAKGGGGALLERAPPRRCNRRAPMPTPARKSERTSARPTAPGNDAPYEARAQTPALDRLKTKLASTEHIRPQSRPSHIHIVPFSWG